MDNRIEPYKGIAVVYEEIRPNYPEQLIEDIISRTGIKPGDRLLEIGSGTGKATMQFAERGFTVRANELGEDMAAILKEKCADFKNVTVDVSPFEVWTGEEDDEFDMIYCAQTFHWLDPALKYEKCRRLLKDNGYLVLFWYSPYRDDSNEAQAIQNRLDGIVNRYASEHYVKNENIQRREHDGVTHEDQRLLEIEASGLFTVANKTEYLRETKSSADQYIKQMKSVPAFATILDGLDETSIRNMDNEIMDVINEHGGFTSAWLKYSLYIAKKRQSAVMSRVSQAL